MASDPWGKGPQKIDPETLRRLLALRPAGTPGWTQTDMNGGGSRQFTGTGDLSQWTFNDFAGNAWQGGDAGQLVNVPEQDRQALSLDTSDDYVNIYDTSGNFIEREKKDGDNEQLAKFIAAAVASYFGVGGLNEMAAAGAAAGGAAGTSAAEAAFLEANMGALAPTVSGGYAGVGGGLMGGGAGGLMSLGELPAANLGAVPGISATGPLGGGLSLPAVPSTASAGSSWLGSALRSVGLSSLGGMADTLVSGSTRFGLGPLGSLLAAGFMGASAERRAEDAQGFTAEEAEKQRAWLAEQRVLSAADAEKTRGLNAADVERLRGLNAGDIDRRRTEDNEREDRLQREKFERMRSAPTGLMNTRSWITKGT